MNVDLSKLAPEVRTDVELLLGTMDARIIFLEAQIKLLLHKRFGPASEKIPFEQLQLLGMELSVTQDEMNNEAAEAQRNAAPATPNAPAPNQGHPGRNDFPAHLERRERIVPCTPQDCLCGQFSQTKVVIGYETSEELDLVPARYFGQVAQRIGPFTLLCESQICLDLCLASVCGILTKPKFCGNGNVLERCPNEQFHRLLSNS